MKQAIVRVFPSMNSATAYANLLKQQKHHVVISEDVDIVLTHQPGDTVTGWPDGEKNHYVVFASHQPLQSV